MLDRSGVLEREMEAKCKHFGSVQCVVNRDHMTPETNCDPFTIRIGTWNTRWAKPSSIGGKIISKVLAASDCDVLCVTEGFAGILPEGGHVIDAGKDWGYRIYKGRRKVLLWSKQPWTPHIDAVGSADLPGGRFVAGSTETLSGACLTAVGVCIPWSGAHVKSGRKDRTWWQDHEAWLAGFGKLRSGMSESRTIILGDFNQRIPKTHAPLRAYKALNCAFNGFKFATEGELSGGQRLIDHIAHTPDLTPGSIGVWDKQAADGTSLSDHFGVWCDFSAG
ncbi:MAG: endonuclease/exonuclease/phosphatase family protein [Acidobacteriia bacterium]|nr:endonuclease/exonuclease/phosphatase family protein [Terriglobia bacterium]MYG01183.1 endonuclease/exonuclease/phosphatase family protein [Terriglobia bacterium]MYK12410.1 endonuclease/exonuclease/phosphatase family protein [Terriglobia bacterium]